MPMIASGTSAEVLLDSVGPHGKRLTTFVIRYPRIIIAEVNTHRMLSKSSASSRAIPVERMITTIQDDPFIPDRWPKTGKGMQPGGFLQDPADIDNARAAWLAGRDVAVVAARNLLDQGVHKEIANRLLEPWAYVVTIISGTEWENYFALRLHKDAQRQFQLLAYVMGKAFVASKPREVSVGGWHIPFGDRMPEGLSFYQRFKVATARCARVSYNNFDGVIDPEKDYALHDQITTAGHWVPTEHIARCLSNKLRIGNFIGWNQYRKRFPNENRQVDDLSVLIATYEEAGHHLPI